MKYLYYLYQLLVALPLLVVVTILTTLIVSLGWQRAFLGLLSREVLGMDHHPSLPSPCDRRGESAPQAWTVVCLCRQSSRCF